MENYRYKDQKQDAVDKTELGDFLDICRVCLEPGDIPIFGNVDNPNISDEVIIFGEINLSLDDNLPHQLCCACHKLLQGAIEFRNSAKHAEVVLKNAKRNTVSTCRYYGDGRHSFSDYECSILSKNGTDELHSEYMSIANGESDDHKHGSDSLKTEQTMKQDKPDNQSIAFDENLLEMVAQNDNEMVMIIVSNNDDEAIGNDFERNIASEILNCDICSMDFELSDDYIQHTKTLSHINTEKRSQKVLCEICNKLVSKTYITSHLAKHKFDPVVNENECKICDVTFQSREELKLHQETEAHGKAVEESTKIECNICHKLIGKAYYKSHRKVHGSEAERQERQRKCPICLKYFSCTYYKDHMRRVHNIDDKIRAFEEETSAKDSTVSKSSSELESLRKKSAETQYVCDICGKISKKPTAFKLHAMTHGSELKYKCMFCPYRGLHQGLLKVHVRTHTGDYNYECPKCHARFITKSNLNKHLKRHMGPVDFKCDTCHRGFYSKLELERHYEIDHLGIKNYACNICGKAFGRRNHMMNHQLKVHKREKLTKGKGRLPNYLQAQINQ